jgi:signal transduction histidine kinase
VYNSVALVIPNKSEAWHPPLAALTTSIRATITLASRSVFKSILTYSLVALAAGSLSFALWLAGIMTPVESALLLAPRDSGLKLHLPVGWWGGVTPIFVSAVIAAILVGRLGGRRAFVLLIAGLVGLISLSLFSSWYFALDVRWFPLAFAALLSACAAQFKRLRDQDNKLTEKLNLAARRCEAFHVDDAQHSLLSGLKLLDNVLAPSEAIVFRRDGAGRLVSSARLRAPQMSASDSGRNTTWRDGVSLCERALAAGDIVVELTEGDESATNIALPLRHEERTVGALLLRVTGGFAADDRALLLAVGAQLARNLQREEAHQARDHRSLLAFFSARESGQRLQSLYVLNGALLEQSVGTNALSQLEDGVALAYLDGRIAYTNAALAGLGGFAREKVSKLNFFELLDAFRTDIFDEPAIAVRRVLETGEPYERELSFPDRNATYGLRISLVMDSTHHNEAQVPQPEPHSQPLCLSLVVKDLTLLKEYEQLKSDMISLMSHELRTPLTSINGFAELLTADEALPEQAREFVTIIANESQRLSRMINTFLSVTKLQRKDRQEVLKIPLRLDEVVKETVATLQTAAKKRRIRLVEQPTQRLPPVAADKSLITQAIKNLVGNAIKYSPERTTVTVSTALEAEAVRLSVEDRGYGIPAEARDRVWEKFYRVVREGQEKDEESTGLGLSFVREVVEQHGGSVKLDSEVGRGSKFSFTLPRL